MCRRAVKHQHNNNHKCSSAFHICASSPVSHGTAVFNVSNMEKIKYRNSPSVVIAPLWKSGGYTGFALPFLNSVILSYLWGQLANVDQILYEASLGWGKGCIRFWDRLDQNSGFHGNRKHPLTYNGENDVFTFSLLFFFRIFSNLQVTRTGIKSWTSANFGQIGPLPAELGALERLKNFP